MRKPGHIYIGAFFAVFATGVISIAYLEGGIDEQLRESSDVTAAIAQEQAKADYWQDKYDSLARESDWLTIADAAANFRGERR